MKEFLKRLIPLRTRRGILSFLNRLWVWLCLHLPLRDRVCFYTIRANGALLENARAVYDALDCKKVIFAQKLPHEKLHKVKAYYLLLTSRIIVLDDYCRYLRTIRLRESQRVLQIWHACGAFKMFGLDAPSQLTPAEERATHAQYTAVAVTAESCRAPYAGAFGIPADRCLPIGLPRTDRLLADAPQLRDGFFRKYPHLAGRTLYLYCPTFRERDGVQIPFDPGIDWGRLSRALHPNELLIVCRHPIMTESLLDAKYDNLIDLTHESTVALTAACRVLITDYSSVMYDACLLGTPTVFYCPDLADYERGFYIRFPEDLPGPMVTDPAQLLETIRTVNAAPPEMQIEAFRRKQLAACDGHATERAAALVRQWLEEKE